MGRESGRWDEEELLLPSGLTFFFFAYLCLDSYYLHLQVDIFLFAYSFIEMSGEKSFSIMISVCLESDDHFFPVVIRECHAFIDPLCLH